MRSHIRSIVDDLPEKIFDDNRERAMTTIELANHPKCQMSERSAQRLVREMVGRGQWEQVWRHVPGKPAVPVYRTVTEKKKK